MALGVACVFGAKYLLAAQFIKLGWACLAAALSLTAFTAQQVAPFIPEATAAVVAFVKRHPKVAMALGTACAATLGAMALGTPAGAALVAPALLGAGAGFAAAEAYEKSNALVCAILVIAALFICGVISVGPLLSRGGR